jgi:hypothetical protein
VLGGNHLRASCREEPCEAPGAGPSVEPALPRPRLDEVNEQGLGRRAEGTMELEYVNRWVPFDPDGYDDLIAAVAAGPLVVGDRG